MTTAPRDALDRLIAALEAHLDAVKRKTGENDAGVASAYLTLADAFETYDDSLYDAFEEVTPMVLIDEEEFDEDDDEDEDFEEEEEGDEGEDDELEEFETDETAQAHHL